MSSHDLSAKRQSWDAGDGTLPARVTSAAAGISPAYRLAAQHRRELTHLSLLLFILLVVATVRILSEFQTHPMRTAASLPVVADRPASIADVLVAPVLREPESILAAAPSGEQTLVAAAPGLAVDEAATDSPDPSVSAKAPFTYTIERGDTVSGIADRFGISSDTVMQANDIYSPTTIRPGDQLVILPVSGVLHTVASGETLSDVATLYGVTPDTVAEYNDLVDPGLLHAGERLVVPDGRIMMARASPSSRGGARSAQPSSSGATGSFRWPTTGGISTYYSPAHRGIDIMSSTGVPVYASDGGVIVTARKDSYDYGWHLVIDHGNGFETLYGHLSAFYAGYGERVEKGERIGAAGSTGLSTGPHLHFEVWENNVKMNPLNYLP